MIPKIDLFHQVIYRQDGYVAIAYFENLPWQDIHVFRPDGEWCGCTNTTTEEGRKAAIRKIIKYNQDYERRKQNNCKTVDAPRGL